MKSLHLKQKIPLLMVGVIVALVVLILFAVSFIVNRATAVNLHRDLMEARTALAAYENLRIRETRLVASLPFFKAMLRTKDGPSILQLAENLQEKIGNDLFIITDETGTILARTDVGSVEKEPFSHPVVKVALEKSETSGLLKVGNEHYHVSGIPVLFRNRVFGTVVVGFRIDESMIKGLNLLTKSETSFVTEDGIIASAWTGDQRADFSKHLRETGIGSKEWFEKEGKQAGFEWVIGGEDYIVSAIPLGISADGRPSGQYFLKLSKSKATEFIGTIQKTIILPGLIVGVITAWVSYLLLQQILVPIGWLKKASREISSGNLSITPIGVSHENEIGVLVSSFNDMVDGLKKVERLKQKAEDEKIKAESHRVKADDQREEFKVTLTETARSVADASKVLTDSSLQLNQNYSKVSEQVSRVSAASEQNNQSIESVTAASEEIESTIQEISRNAQKANEITMKAVQMMDAAKDIIIKLEASGEDVGKVVNFIVSIAEQTNLLALNASIEAARAGQSGKGFAVVANEVKSLAKETAKATDEIRKKVSNIQSDAAISVDEVSGVAEVIAEINDISSGISFSIEGQAKRISEINHNIMEVAKGSREALESIEEVTLVSKSTEEEGKTVLLASQQLSEMGQNLIEIVDKLKAGNAG